eukprot:TRINITY_DN74494_c0_g1_i1.p1 TRINITY_DN74494_c0_g1~~TRINITY_DN74494_c0_g1_i1.p1  ORF type:complete len:695 (-),score=88.54 TRINITY_DN74494_c0_g1_i1:318-2402(-)
MVVKRTSIAWSLLSCLASQVAAVSYDVRVSAWCRDSFRVQILPEASKGTQLLGALSDKHCQPAVPADLNEGGSGAINGNLRAVQEKDGRISFHRVDTGTVLFAARVSLAISPIEPGYRSFNVTLKPGDNTERIYGLGQGGWTPAGGESGGCASGTSEHVVPLVRNGQTIQLLQRKFHVSIPFAYSTAGYGFLFNMPGYGSVSVGAQGSGGMLWQVEAAETLDFWVTTAPASSPKATAEPIYERYADATGHAPLLRDDALLFWQSRLRYMTSSVALDVASKYQALDLPVGVLVVDYFNQVNDGDFKPDPRCYPSLKDLSEGVRAKINASVVFSIWPEAKSNSEEFSTLKANGCLLNADLGGQAMNPTTASCRQLIWNKFVKPRYFDQGVTAFWLDETDGEGTGGGDGNFGYNTSYGPASVASNLWVNDWLRTFTEPVATEGETPLVLTRGVWAGGQRHGIVLWSSDIESSFEELNAQVPQGIHASLSGIPWWTSDVGGFGCGREQSNDSPYMRELIVRWYQFGLFCPVFRTHGKREGNINPRPQPDPCNHGQGSGAGNEVWSYGPETQALLEKYVRLRKTLRPYMSALAKNVSSFGVPTMRPLWWHFPHDEKTYDINDQYFLGPDLMVAPITVQGARSRQVYFPAGASWTNFFNSSDVIKGGSLRSVQAPLDVIPVYFHASHPASQRGNSQEFIV